MSKGKSDYFSLGIQITCHGYSSKTFPELLMQFGENYVTKLAQNCPFLKIILAIDIPNSKCQKSFHLKLQSFRIFWLQG